MAIGKPRTAREIEDLKWQVRFDTVSIFIKQHHWYLLVKGTCMFLGPDNLCTIYEQRPAKCRGHQPPHCESFGQYHDVLIRTPQELESYLAAHRRHKKKRAPYRPPQER